MTSSSRSSKPPAVASQPRSRKALLWCAVATGVLLAADLTSKTWAQNELSTERFGEPPPVCEPDDQGRIFMQRARTEPLVLIDGYLEFRYAENCGAAFGIMSSGFSFSRILFVLAAAGATLVLLLMFVRGRGQTLFAWSVPLVVSGALGNLTDRLRFGYVVDFIRFHLQEGWEYPTFNVADITITIGVILLVLDGFREGRAERLAHQASAESSDPEPSG